jgi:predicted SPOUT superfamily RNA methylase MTH1
LFPHHADLRFAGLLNPLDAPHHPRLHERLTYREGVTIERPPEAGGNGNGTPVDIGLRREVMIDYTLKPGVRVTLKLPPNDDQPKRGPSHLHMRTLSPFRNPQVTGP